jgi:PAS domain S-box-containing protein
MAKRITLIYLLLGLAWITLSSWALQEIMAQYQLNEQQFVWLERWKGYFFIIATALIFYGFIHRILLKNNNDNKHFRQMFDDNPNPMWVYDKETLRILAVNQAMVEEYGYTRPELLQMTIKQIRPLESIVALENRLQENIPTHSKSGIWCHQRKNGELFYVRIYSNATDYKGQPSRLVMAFDITPIIQAEQENRVLNSRLEKKQRYLLSLIDSQTTFLIRINTEGQYTFVNPAFCQKLNYPLDYMLTQSFISDLPPADAINVRAVIEQCLQQPGTVVPIMLHQLSNQGNPVTIQWEFVAIKTAKEKITELQGMGRDVTEEVASQTKIKEYTQRIHDILESITDGFCAIDKNWNFTYVNKEFERLLFSKRETIMGTLFWEQFPESVSLQFFSEFHRAMQEQTKVHFEEYYPRFQAWFKVAAYPTPEGLAVYFQDITLEKKAQEKDFEDAQNLNALINNPSALIWSVNVKYQLISANEPFLTQMSQTLGVLLQKGDNVLYPELSPKLVNKWLDLYQRAFKGEIYTVEDQETYPDGTVTYYEMSFNPIRDRDGRITGTGCFLRNITENKLHQIKIQEQNEKLKEIAWIQSHRVRVPVANILGLVNAFNYQNVSDPFNQEVLTNLHTVTNDLDLIIREIVDKTNEIEDRPSDLSNMRLMLGDRIDIHPNRRN